MSFDVEAATGRDGVEGQPAGGLSLPSQDRGHDSYKKNPLDRRVFLSGSWSECIKCALAVSDIWR